MLLFCGQPGVGKTLAAHWMAQELKLPLLTLNLATVMSSFLGKTGNNVRAVFEHAISRPCVLLLDEFDALAKRRNDDTDVEFGIGSVRERGGQYVKIAGVAV